MIAEDYIYFILRVQHARRLSVIVLIVVTQVNLRAPNSPFPVVTCLKFREKKGDALKAARGGLTRGFAALGTILFVLSEFSVNTMFSKCDQKDKRRCSVWVGQEYFSKIAL